MSDLLDRKMISLYGGQHEKLDKVDVTNTSKAAKDAKNRKSPEPQQPNVDQPEGSKEEKEEVGSGLRVAVNPQREEKLKRIMKSTDAYVD